ATSNETSFTACTAPTSRANTPFLMGKDFFRFLTETSGCVSFMPRPRPLRQRVECGDDSGGPARSRYDSATCGLRLPDRAADAPPRTIPRNRDSGRETDIPSASRLGPAPYRE